MREKELRLALICYGGVSLAVYMHGITKEVWRLARASRAYFAGEDAGPGTDAVYRELLEAIEQDADVRLRVLVDVVAGASAGGINGVFLANAIATGQSLDPLTDLWLERADVDVLLAPEARASRFSKVWATPIAWLAAGRHGGETEPNAALPTNGELRAKLSAFVRARWFAPPFGGEGFTAILLDSFDAMARSPCGPPLLPDGQPLDLFVTVTEFHGHPERLALHSPPEVTETEHRLTLSFADHGRSPRDLGNAAELVFAARATASFPGAFPPFTVAELDRVLAGRGRAWPGRAAFLARVLPRQSAAGTVDSAVLIDGSVLVNAPFRPAMEALRDRPARREVDRRFVYIDPKPTLRDPPAPDGTANPPGFFATIFGALSDIPREQPIRDNLEAMEAHSARVRRMQHIVDAIRPEVEAQVEALFGRTFLLDRPTPERLAGWRARAQGAAARAAGFAYVSYGRIKLSAVVDEITSLLHGLAGAKKVALEPTRTAIWAAVEGAGLASPAALSSQGASAELIRFLRDHDLGFRIRRLRLLAHRIARIEEARSAPRATVQQMRDAIYGSLAAYLDRRVDGFFSEALVEVARTAIKTPGAALAALAAARDLTAVDATAERALAAALGFLPRAERRTLLLAYLGFPYFDVATLPLLQGEGLDEFNEIKVDRIAPDDAVAIRSGGAEATLKGIRFNSFGAFFSRAYRENDYLWGRLHGADRLIDIVVAAIPAGSALAIDRVADLKRSAFRAILAEERDRLRAIPDLFESLKREIG
jgi:patatin-related protein